jgi:hypothetical protein
LLAHRAIVHAILELQFDIELDRDLNGVNGEGRDITAGCPGATLWLRWSSSGNTFALEATSGKLIPFGKRVAASEALEVEATIEREFPHCKVAPVEAARLLGSTLVAAVLRAFERPGVTPALYIKSDKVYSTER